MEEQLQPRPLLKVYKKWCVNRIATDYYISNINAFNAVIITLVHYLLGQEVAIY